ncbi:MAG: nitronate monooxygenase [Spirochaeta sp.]|jgi:nitronate monooxygenase|nr:nitronate monooxygenase [Spirochaeta sp.]
MTAAPLETAISTLKELTTDVVEDFGPAHLLARVKRYRRAVASRRLNWPSLRIGELIASVPIIQGGMGVGISLSRLASAVANAGGIGVIAANGIGLLEPDYYKDGRAANLRAFRREIRAAREQTDGIIGVNIMVAVNDFHELLDVAIEEGVDLVFMGAGLPIKNLPVEAMRAAGVKAVPIVSSVRATEMIFRMWQKIYHDVPDAVVFEGPLAGGHLGFTAEQIDDSDYQLETIVPDIVRSVEPFETEFGRSIPVIAGGGVYDGGDINRVLELGAQGVQMGTRFVATEECDADDVFKDAYVQCAPEDIGLIHSPVGMPGRAIRNDFIVDAEEGRRPAFRCAWQCLSSCKANDAKYCISIALNNARKGNLRGGFVFAGANAHRVTEVVPVSDLIGELSVEYRVARRTALAERLEPIVGRARELRERCADLAARVQELGVAYENALNERIDNAWSAGETGIARVREQYEETLSKLRNTQFLLTERLADSWELERRPDLQL